MKKRQSFSSDEVNERSLQHSIRDGVAFYVMAGSGESYFSAFAVFLRATTAQVGLIATLPPLIASFFQLVSVWLGRKTGRRKEIIVAGAIIQAAILIPLAVLPLLLPDFAVPALLLCAIIYYIGPNLGSPQWGSLMGTIVPEARRGRFFARRTRLSSMASFSSLLGAGITLELFDGMHHAAAGFITIFSFACVARCVSTWHLIQMHDPGMPPAPPVPVISRDLIKRLAGSRFFRFSLFFAAMQFTVAISGPFIVVHMLRDLEFSYLALTFNSAASVLMQFVTLNRWGRLSDLFGNRLILVVTGFTIPFIPTLWVLSSNYVWLLAVQALSGLVWSGFTLSAGNFVYDLTQPERRATYMAVHGTFAATAVFLGASLGGFLATIIPHSFSLGGLQITLEHTLYGVFMTATVLRLAVATAFLPRLKEVRRVRSMTPAGLIFRVTRFSNVSGLTFDPVFRTRAADKRDQDTNKEDESGK